MDHEMLDVHLLLMNRVYFFYTHY